MECIVWRSQLRNFYGLEIDPITNIFRFVYNYHHGTANSQLHALKQIITTFPA